MTTYSVIDKFVVEEKLKFLFETELSDAIKWKLRWKKIGNITLGVSKALVTTALLFDFISGFYKNDKYTFLAGCTNTLALALMAYSGYAYTESKKRNNNLLKLLKLNHIQTGIKIPDSEPEEEDNLLDPVFHQV
jgi:hypothetical protein